MVKVASGATAPPDGTLKDTVVRVFVIVPIVAPFIVPTVTPFNPNPDGKVITTSFPTAIVELRSLVVFAVKV